MTGDPSQPADPESPTGPRKVGMADFYSSKLQIWDGWLPDLAPGRPFVAGRPGSDDGLAAHLFAAEALGRAGRDTADPYSLQWFPDAEQARHHRNGTWIPRSLEFTKHGGETLLGLGDGLGTDWVQYARH